MFLSSSPPAVDPRRGRRGRGRGRRGRGPGRRGPAAPELRARPARTRAAWCAGSPTWRRDRRGGTDRRLARARLLGCGLLELVAAAAVRAERTRGAPPASLAAAGALRRSRRGSVGALAWTAFKVGALAFGGGFVIVPLMQGDAVHAYHWMTNAQFLNAVALGQVTPGPVVATVAAVGYGALRPRRRAARRVGRLPARRSPSSCSAAAASSACASNPAARAFLDGAGPAAIGAILGAAIPLAGALQETWQFAILAARRRRAAVAAARRRRDAARRRRDRRGRRAGGRAAAVSRRLTGRWRDLAAWRSPQPTCVSCATSLRLEHPARPPTGSRCRTSSRAAVRSSRASAARAGAGRTRRSRTR